MKTTDFYSSATGTLQVKGGRDENAPAGVSLSIDDLSYIKQGSRANEGSTGTSDYNDMSNKPSINSVELKGNKSLNDLGIQPKIDSSHKVSADNIDDTNTTNKFATASQLVQIETNKNNILTVDDTIKNQLPPFNTNFTPTAEVSTSYDSNGWLDVDITGTVSADTTISAYGGYFYNTLGGIKLYYDIGSTSNVQLNVVYSYNGTNAAYTAQNVSSGYTISDSYPYVGLFIVVKTGATQDFKFKSMACTENEYTISPTYTRFAPNNLLLYKMIKALS